MACPILQGARRDPENLALISSDAELTYRELNGMVEKCLLSLTANGIVAGNRVGLHAVTNIDTVVSLFALARLGATVCLLNTRWPPAELKAVVDMLHVEFILNERGDLAHKSSGIATTRSESGVVFFTSGSSALPKAALLSFANLIYNAAGSNERIPLDDDSCWVLSLPLFHVGGVGILYRSFLAGGAVAIPKQGESLASSISRLTPTHLSVVHTQLWRLLKDESFTIRKWPVCLLGGGPTTSELIAFAVSRGILLHASYGLTEMGSQVTTTHAIGESADPSMTGSALPYRKVQIFPSGEICVAGETLFQGYLTDSGLDSSRDESGWLHTGDIGEWSADGSLRILGRKDNQFVSGGENIHPEAIEAVLMSTPGIETAMVVPQGDIEFGKRPVAFIAPEGSESLRRRTVDYAQQILADRLPGYMHPIAWYALPAEWQSGGIKPRRRELMELLKRPKDLIPPAP